MVVSGLEVENVEELSFTLISIREASEELSFGDGVRVVLTSAWECGGKAAELRGIVGAGQADNEAVLSRGEVVVSNGVRDVDVEFLSLG